MFAMSGKTAHRNA